MVVDHSSNKREQGEFIVSVNNNSGILFIFDTGTDVYEHSIPAGDKKVESEYANYKNIKNFRDILDDFLLNKQTDDRNPITEAGENPHSTLRKIFSNFPQSMKPLKNRRNNKDPIQIVDEHSLQDIVESHLRVFFEDVRTEEQTPSKSGSGAKIDFMLKKEEIAIELKKTRENLEEKKLCDEILSDINRYIEHPSCEIIYFFIYDPEVRIANPSEVYEIKQNSEYPVKIIISPE